MPASLSGLAGDLSLADTNHDVYEKTAANCSDVNDWGVSVVLHRNKKREKGNHP
jgi:hypothetical protein